MEDERETHNLDLRNKKRIVQKGHTDSRVTEVTKKTPVRVEALATTKKAVGPRGKVKEGKLASCGTTELDPSLGG